MKKLSILIAGIFSLLLFQTASAAVFSDVASSHKNYKAINYLHENKVIQGYSDNTFRPNQKVNRAEALKIILLGSKVLVPDIAKQTIFPDVLHGAWYAKFIVKAKNLSIVKGDDKTGLFRPGDTVNLAEALKILLKTNNKKDVVVTSNPYWDVPKDSWFASYFAYAKSAGLLDASSKSNVKPATPITRGMLAELMYRLATSSYAAPDGKASFYGEKFHGKTTASGDTFDASKLTAAHRSYPFGTWLQVTNVANNKSVVVKVNDRGPYTNDNRIIDLSKAAFESIAPLSSGVINVTLEKTNAPTSNGGSSSGSSSSANNSTSTTNLLKGDLLNSSKIACASTSSIKYIQKDTFTGLILDSEIPKAVILDEVLTIKGKTIGSPSKVTAFIVDSSKNQTAFSGKVKNNYFEINVRFPKTDTFKLGLLPGDSGQSVVDEIKVWKNTCIEEIESSKLSPVSGLNVDLREGDTVVTWNKGGYNLFKLTFAQDGLHKSYILKDINELKPVYKEFTDFKAANMTIYLRGANITKKSILEPLQIIWSPPTKTNVMSAIHHEYNVNESDVRLISLTESIIVGGDIKASFQPKVPVRSKAAFILPNGTVKEVQISASSASPTKNTFGIEVFESTDKTLEVNYTSGSTNVHFLEVNNDKGLAVINVPIYPKGQFPFMPNTRDLSKQSIVDLGTDLLSQRSTMLNLVNNDRNKYNLSPLKIDSKLNNLAQSRSDDMIIQNYFSHWDKGGNSVNDLRLNYGITTTVGENLAKDVTMELAQYGLMRSAIHRSNILSKDWTRVGFGVSKAKDGSYIFVQIFSSDPLNIDDVKKLRSQVTDVVNKNRSSVIGQKDNLNTIAQNWSEKMVNENFFDLTDKNKNTLIDAIHNAGIKSALGTYILGNTSWSDALKQITGNVEIQKSKWRNIGIGIRQDSAGLIKITLIYTE